MKTDSVHFARHWTSWSLTTYNVKVHQLANTLPHKDFIDDFGMNCATIILPIKVKKNSTLICGGK